MIARVRNAFRALRHRNLRLFFAGHGVSLVGTWMQQVAMSWLVYRLTDSELLLGVIAFAGQFPGLLMAPFAGWLVDHWNRHRIVVMAQALLMAQATVLAVLVITARVEVWHLVTLAVFSGLVNGADIPARQSMLVRLVGGAEDLPNAIALNSSMFNAARLVGPAVAGVLIGWVGEGPVFVLNALSYIAVLAALLAMRLPAERAFSSGPVLAHIKEGFAYAFGSPPTRDTLILFACVSLVGVPYVVLLPAFARDVLAGDARTLGVLTSCAGLGALGGALWLAARDSLRGIGSVVVRSTSALGVTLIAFAASRAFWLSAGAARREWLRPDVGDRIGQYGHPDPRERPDARPGDEPLRDGVHRGHPRRELGGRSAGHAVGGAVDRGDRGPRVRGARGRVPAPARHPGRRRPPCGGFTRRAARGRHGTADRERAAAQDLSRRLFGWNLPVRPRRIMS
jgi:MFS family permease